MEIPHTDIQIFQVFSQAFGHALGQRRNEDAFAFLRDPADLPDQIVHLAGRRPQDHLRIQQACRPDDLLDDLLRAFALVRSGCRGNEDRLPDAPLEFLKEQGAVVVGGRQAEAVFHKGVLPCPVPVVHCADLRHGHMALVNDGQEFTRKVVQQRIRCIPRLAAVKVAGIVFDSLTVADLPHHFDVVAGALRDALGFQEAVVRLKLLNTLLQVLLDLADMLLHMRRIRCVMRRRKEGCMLQRRQCVAADRFDNGDPFDLVPEEFHADRLLVLTGRNDLDHVAPDAEGTAFKVCIVALVLDVNQVADQLPSVVFHARAQGQHLPFVFARVAHGIDAADRRDNDDILPLAQGRGGGMAQTVDLVVDGRVLFNVSVGRSDVSLRLVIVIIADEVFHAAVRKERLQLTAQLGGQRLVVRDDERRHLHFLNDRRHGERLAAARNAQQDLVLQPGFDAFRQRLDSLGLVSGCRVRRLQDKLIHAFSSCSG